MAHSGILVFAERGRSKALVGKILNWLSHKFICHRASWDKVIHRGLFRGDDTRRTERVKHSGLALSCEKCRRLQKEHAGEDFEISCGPSAWGWVTLTKIFVSALFFLTYL